MATISGGAKLEKALAQIAENLSGPAAVKVGFFATATYPSGKPVAMIAAIHEYGAPRAGIPPRPFMRPTIAKYGPTWPAAIAANLKATNYDATKTMTRVGLGVKGQIQQAIRDVVEPPLKPATIKRKGFDKPLVHTGQMLKSVDFEVE